MNGRHVVSWGVDTTQRSKGSVARALYNPRMSRETNPDSEERPVTGIESRYFHFVPGQESKSAAKDGGLIEVRVFRCKERRRTAATLEHYRDQEQYGIA